MAVVLNLFILEDDPHRWVGYAAVAVLLIRLTWGFTKKASPRWKDWSTHNIMASLTYIGIWSLVLSMGITGWLMGTDRFWGEEWLEEIHENLSYGIKVLVVMHLLGIIIDSVRNRRPTWKSMITGKRTLE